MVGKKSQRKIKFQALLYKQKQIIDCADEVENSWNIDAVCRNVLPFLKESITKSTYKCHWLLCEL